MFAPREATEAHRPVVAMLGLVECDELPAPLGERVTRDIERQLFAFVPTDEEAPSTPNTHRATPADHRVICCAGILGVQLQS